MEILLKKRIGLTLTLITLFFISNCGGGKQGDMSSLLLLLTPNKAVANTGVSEADGLTYGSSPVETSSESVSENQGVSDLILLNPKLVAWIDIQDHSQCFTYFTVTVKNQGNGTFNPYSTISASVQSITNVKNGVQVGHAFRNLRPGETQDLAFIAKYSIEDIDDPNGDFKISAEFIGVTDGSPTNSDQAVASASNCKASDSSSQPQQPAPEKKADLIASISRTATEILPGEDISQKFPVWVSNQGIASANGSSPSNAGYMVDLILSSDTNVPEGYAVYSPNYKEDVLLAGGRISNTPNVEPGQQVRVSEGSNFVPKDVPAGNYFLCARVDVGSVVSEIDEKNNTVCIPVVVPSKNKPDLIIPRASIYPSGRKCRAGVPMMYITAEVKNIGTVASPKKLDVGLINALDTKGEIWGPGNGIGGNGIGLDSIQPGETVTVTFPIYFNMKDLSYNGGKHTYDLRVNRGNWIQESDVKNNGYKKILEITLPEDVCM
ncbi:CARDB domain-containing protein [Leptospira yasudae]|uniref:CARDB domain protein n=1 Tax=Leptospira yasudae TaxID=2202201 RepID=A0ABX9M4C1_9LEPT|nr:CARDB domain-containing protein [Leptospira yasudae]RHX80559.1 CARDB domain protein [Leptospira yasudae]